MPFVDLTLRHPSPSQPTLQAIQQGLTELMAGILRKRADLTVVSVTMQPDASISIGGHSLAPAQWSGRLVAYVTEGTNTEEEKARFLQAAHELLCAQLSAPASPFYIVVQEVPAASWGYDGRTQADRARQPIVAAQAR